MGSVFLRFPDGRGGKWRVPVFLAGLTLVFYWKVLFTNRAMFPWDAANFFYPYLSFVHEELRHWRMPLWDPYVMSGFPIIGDPEAQIFYPLNWFFLLFQPLSPLPYRLLELQLILHFFLAGLFMYYLALSFVKNKAAALFSAVLFPFSGAMIVHTEHLASIESIAWYPLILLLARKGLLERKTFLTVLAGFVFGIHILSGHWQHSVYLGAFLFLYFGYEACFGPLRAKLWPRWIYELIIIGSIGSALAMVQIIPTYELGNQSVRSDLTYHDVTDGSEPRYLLTLFLPNYFGGLNGVPKWYGYDLQFNYVFLTVPGCLLALLGLVETVRRRNFFWLAFTVLCIDLSFGRHGYLALFAYHLPLINLFRNMATFFDLVNLSFCLMAAVGAEALLSGSLPRMIRKYLPVALLFVLCSTAIFGLALNFATRIHGWYHMLSILAVVSLIVTAMLWKKLLPRIGQWALLGIMIFELFFYNMNQRFNAFPMDPRTFLSHDLALGQGGVLKFLRSDPNTDFKVAAFAGREWSGNGWNVWRIPGIFGWNPMTLRRYETYIKGFTNTSEYTLPYGSPDHNLASSMLDLLGTKYVTTIPSKVSQINFARTASNKFELIYEDQGWMQTYRNQNYLSRAWFFRKTYAVANEEELIGLMSSAWFNGRQVLLFEKGDLPKEMTKMAEELPTITLSPSQNSAASSGSLRLDKDCAKPLPVFADWGGKVGDSLGYDLPAPAQPGRYLLIIQYTAASQPAPTLEVELLNDAMKQHSGPFTLPSTFDWSCKKSKTADLGTFEITQVPSQLTLTSKVATGIHIFSLWLVRLPTVNSPDPESFSFEDFSVSANAISFLSRQEHEGFILLNEIYYPGWSARVDGKPVEILRSDSIFRTVYVPAGAHRLEFIFHPNHLYTGAAVSLLALTGCLGYLGIVWKRS